MILLQKLRRTLESPPTDGVPRRVFGVLAGVLALECCFELWSWLRGNGELINVLGLAGISLLMLFFFSRQPRVRLFSYICGMSLILVRIAFYIRQAFHYLGGP